jgi:hypothetical protein
MINNKGVWERKLVFVASFTLVAILMMMFTGTIIAKSSEKYDIETCRQAVLFSSVAQYIGDDLAIPDCATNNIIFHENYVEVNEDEKEVKINGERTKGFKRLTSNIVNQVVAEELRNCWYQFHEGKMEIFGMSEDKLFGIPFFGISGDEGTICYRCADISFSNDVSSESFSGFNQYLSNTMPQSQMSYADYIVTAPRRSSDKYCTGYTSIKDQFNTNQIFDIDARDNLPVSGRGVWLAFTLGRSGEETDYAGTGDEITYTKEYLSPFNPVGVWKDSEQSDDFDKNKKYSIIFIKEGQLAEYAFDKVFSVEKSVCKSPTTYAAYVVESSTVDSICAKPVMRGGFT